MATRYLPFAAKPSNFLFLSLLASPKHRLGNPFPAYRRLKGTSGGETPLAANRGNDGATAPRTHWLRRTIRLDCPFVSHRASSPDRLHPLGINHRNPLKKLLLRICGGAKPSSHEGFTLERTAHASAVPKLTAKIPQSRPFARNRFSNNCLTKKVGRFFDFSLKGHIPSMLRIARNDSATADQRKYGIEC